MTLTESKALNLIANQELTSKVANLEPLHQRYQNVKRSIARRKGCSRCNASDPEFAQLKKQAVHAIRGLPPDQLQALKDHLVIKKVVVFEMVNGKRKKIVL